MPQDPIIALLQSQGLDPFAKSKPLSGLESATNLTRAAEVSGAAFQPYESQIAIGKGVQSILEADIQAANANVSTTLAMGNAKDLGFTLPQIADIDLNTKNELKDSADILNRVLREGTIEESQKALSELREKYNRVANSSLGSKGKDTLRKSYGELVDRVNQINTSKLAKSQAEAFFAENSLEDREKMLANPNPNQRLSLNIKSKQTRNSDILNGLADFESHKVGSRLYNEEDLATFKSTYVKTDDDLYAGMEMQYNYAMKNAVDEKVANYQKQISEIDAQIKQSINQDQKNSLALQKANINKELNYSKNLSNKLKPYTLEDNYLKQFYPEQYTRKKEREKQEVYRNEMMAEGDMGSWGESIYRSGQQIKSNFLKQVSGLSYLAGANELGYRIKSGAEYAAPPTYFVGKDLNKNNKIDDAEITRDIHGDRVTMSQVSWTDKNGNKTWNLWAPIEQVLPIATDVATTILLSKGVGAIGRGAGLTYGRIGAAAGLSEAGTASFVKNWAPRISTMGVVTSTTFPRFYAEERSNFKNGDTAFKVALMRAGVEGLTETIVPDVNMFNGKIAYGALDGAFAKLGKLDPASLSRLTTQRDLLLGLLPKGALSPTKAALLMAPAAIRRTLSGATQESVEELGSLVGNYFVDKYASSQNFEVEETNQLTGDAFLDTFVEGFIPSLFISGATNLASRGAMKQERLGQARWNIANNPEKYKQLVANKVQAGKLTKEEGLKQTAAVDNLSKRLDSMTDMKNIKNLTNLLDDKELQFQYFNNHMFQEDLLNVDPTQLSPEQLTEYEDSLAKTSKEILTTKKLSDKYTGLEETDKREIISKLFNSQAKAAVSPNTRMASLLSIAEQTRQSLLTVPPADERYQFVNEEYKKFQDQVDASIVARVTNFKTTLTNNPEQLTALELAMAKETYMPALERMEAIDAGFTLANSPLAPQQGPKTFDESVPELIQSIQAELDTRQILTADDFRTEVPKNLRNPETKTRQEYDLAVSELSEDELATGELEEGVHDHLTDNQRFILAVTLADHKTEKAENPNTLTDLENDIISNRRNLYSLSTRGLSPENTRATIIEMNKAAMEIAPSTPEVNNFSPNPVVVDTTSTPEPIINVPGQLDEVDKEVYNQYANFLNQLNQQLADFDLSSEEARIMLAEFNKSLFDELLKLDSLNKVRSALLAIFPENVEAIESMYEAAKGGNINLDQLGFSPKRKERLIARLTTLIGQADSTPETPVVESNLEKELNELGQKQLSKGFNALLEATNPIEVANAIVNIEQNKNQGARLSKEQEQKLLEAKAKLKEEGYEIVDYNIVRSGENTIVEGIDFYNSERDILTEEQANAIESKINTLEKRGEKVDVDDLPSPVSKTLKPLIKKDGKMVQAAKVNTLIFESVEQAREAIRKSKEAGYKKLTAADKIKAKYESAKNTSTQPIPTNEVSEEAPEVIEDEETIQSDNYDLAQKLPKVTPTSPLKGTKGLELQLLSVSNEDVALNDPAVTLAYNIMDAYSEGIRLGKTQPMNVRIQSVMGIYEFVLPAASVERLNELKQLKSLSPEEKVELRGLLSVNNRPIHNEGMLSFLEENPSEIGTGIGTVFVNSDNNLLKFTTKGKPSTAKTAFVFIPAIKKTGIQSEKEIRERVSRGEILISPVSGIVSGFDKPLPLSKAVGENIYVHTGPATTIKGAEKDFTVKPGVVYLQNENARYQYTGINIPTNGSDIQILVNAFNNGTLPETIDESIRQDASLFLNYLNRQINSTKVGKEDTLKIRFFKGANLFLSTTNDNRLIVKYQVEGKDGKKYLKPSKNQDEDLLKIGQVSYKLVDARFLEDNKPYTALVVSPKGKITTKQFNSYSDFIKSPEFGANYVREENRTFSFSPELESLNTSSVAVDEIDTTPIAPISEVPTTPTQPTPQPAEGPKRLSRRAQLNAQRVGEAPTNDDDVLFRAKVLSNSITGRQNTLAKAWVANHPIFKNTPFIFNETISHPEAYAVWSKAGIFLYEGANYAEAYHEAWHEFSQLYLTPEQKAALYAEARKLYGDLTFVQLEERLADDFRAYALSEGKEFPALIQQARKSKSIFKEIWDFISNLFLNKKTVDHYFSRLYKGNLNGFKRRESNQYFKQLYSGKYTYNDAEGVSHALSYVDSKKYLDDLDSLYVATTSAMSKDKGVTFVNILANPKQANLVYSMMAKRLDSEYTELLESYEQTGNAEYVPRIDAIVDLLENFEATVKFHKQNSFLFEDKVRKALLNNQIVEQESVNAEFAAYEASVNEMSQKQLASQTLISALRTLPRYENGVQVFHPVFGTPLLSDFSSNWNILQRRLSGVNSYSELFSRVENIAEVYPQFTEFLSYLPTPEEDLTFTSDLNFKNEFYRIFSMPYIEGYTTDIKRDEDGNIEDVRVFQAQSLDAQNIRRSFDSAFSLNPSEYSLTNAETGTAYLNTTKYFNTFPGIPAVPIDEEEFEDYNRSLYNMLTPLGFNLSPNSIELFVKEDPTVQSSRVSLIYNKLKSLSQVQAYIATPLASISSSHMIEDKGSQVKVEGENTSVSSIIQYEVEANPQYVNDMRYNAAQKQIWSVNQHTLMTRVLGVLNDEVSYPTLEDVYRELPHLDPTNNPNTIGSFVLSYLFNAAGNRITDKMQNQQVYRKVELGNLLGIKDRGEGEKTIDSNEAKKHYADILGLVKSGVEEINRLSGKSTTRGLIMDLRLRKFLGFNNSTNQVDEFIAYGPVQVPYSLFVSRILPLIKSEVEVTLKGSDKFSTEKDADGNVRSIMFEDDGSPKLTYFHKIFTPEQRTALYAAYTSADSTKSLEDVFKEMPEAQAVFNKFQEYIASNVIGSEVVLGTTYPVDKVDLFKYHFFSFVSRIEQHKIFFNHPYYYKNPKDIEKRLSMWNAFGSYATIDQQNIDYLLSDKSGLSMYSHRDAFHAHAGQVGIKVNANRAAVDQISYLVLKDEPIKSPTAKASKFYGKYKDAYTSDPESEKQNAAAFCTLDFYRKFYSLSTGITLPMKQEFDRQDKIYKKYLELQRADEFTRDQINKELEEELNKGPFYKFIIKKLQYAGHNKIESGESVPVGHKYSMKPILPSEIIGDLKLASILQKLHASSAEYAVFESGTKLSETVKPVSLFNAKGEVQDKAVPVGLIDLKNLKEQVLIENKEDFNNIFSTQFRKLVYKDITTPEGEALYESYKSIIENLTNFDKLNFLEQLDDKEKLVEFLIREISKKNAAESTKDLLRLKEDGTLTHSLDSMVDRTVMESAVVSSVKNQIIKQKLPGAQRVQYPVSLIRPSRKLRFYDIVDGKITKAEAIVSFSKGYYPLLNLLSPVDKQPIGQLDNEGNVINPYTALTRLNEALANPKFRSRYANQLTMEAIRIPGEKHRSMENYEIVEFLPEESGEIILVPDEIVIKSGGDFDIDKLFCYDAVLNADGSFTYGPEITSQEAFELKKDLINRLQENKELFREFYQDKQDLIQDLQDILVSRGIAADTRVSALYKELRSYKYVNEQELVDEGAITKTDQERLRKWAAGEVSTEKKDLSKDIKNRIKVLRATLSEISDEGLSQEIININTRLNVIAKEGRDIKDELKNLRGRFTNRLLLNISNRLSQPEIFEDLIAPNDIAKVKEAVKKFSTPSPAKTASFTNLVSPLYQLYVFSLNTYKTSLGTDAKNNVFHALLQRTTFYREDKNGNRKFLLDANRTVDGFLNFSGVFDVEGSKISNISGEMISAHVDIEKNDGIAQIGLNNVITPVVNYANMAGVRFFDMVKLINLTNGVRKQSSIIRYSRGRSIEEILEDIYENTPEDSVVKSLIDSSKDQFGRIFRDKFINNVFNQMLKNTTSETSKELMLSVQDSLQDLRRFAQFLELEDQTRDLATISLATDYDTFSPQNFESFRSNILSLIPYIKEGGEKTGIFNKKGLDDIINNSIIAPFRVQQDVLDKFVEVFPISANPKITNTILKQFAIAQKINKKLDYDRFSRTFKNDLLYALYINNVPQVVQFETYLDKRSPANLATMFTNLKSRLRNRGIAADNIMFDIMSATTDVDSKYIRTGILDTDLDYSVDMYKEEFEKGFNWSHSELDPQNPTDSELIGDMQAFFKAFAYAGIMGSQLNKKFDSYLPLIPESIYTLPMTSVIENFSRELDASESTVVEREYTPEKVTKSNLPDNGFFVFGSNDRGVHGLGAAKDAVKNFGAVKGQATGKQGQAFAVRTKMYQNGKLTKYNDLTEDNKKVMDRMTVEDLNALRMEAIDNPDNKYYVTVIGTKLAGRSVEQMKDFFSRMNSKVSIPDNIILPEEFEVRTESVSVPSEFNFFKKFITRFTENHPEFRNLEAPKTMTYYKDYLLSRNNVVELFETSLSKVTLATSPTGTAEVITTYFPDKLKRGYSKFYSNLIENQVAVRAGKKITVPNYEDIQLVIEQDTGTIFELTSGGNINTVSSTLKDKIVELQQLFDEKKVYEVLEKSSNPTATSLNSSFGKTILAEPILDNSFALKDSFNSLREINNNLSKNC